MAAVGDEVCRRWERPLRGAGSRPCGRARQSPGRLSAAARNRRRPALPLEAHPAATSTTSPGLTFRSITFEFGSAQLRPESVETLRNLGNALNQELKDEKAFVIEGHTDRTGTRTYNDALSKHRADAVKEYLVNEMGVSAERLQTVGRGYSEPIDPKHPYAAANRRVVMINAGAS